jgi:hypothetical protein
MPLLGGGGGLAAALGLHKPGAEPSYLHALYGLPQLDPRHLAAYRDVLADQFRGQYQQYIHVHRDLKCT